jgi:para-nitrobenzyl esterase
MLQHLGLQTREAGELRRLSAGRLLQAQAKVLAEVSRSSFADRRRHGFNPVIDGRLFPGGPFAPQAPMASARVPLMIGTNKDEMTLFLGHLPWLTGTTFDNLPAALAPYVGERAAEIVAIYRKARPRLRADEIAIAIISDQGIRAPSLLMADRKVAQHAAPVFVYLFAWETPVLGGRLRSCHTLEIPFVFGNLKSAALTGSDPARLELGEKMGRAWIAFARNGDPSHDGLPVWPAYSSGMRSTMIFDAVCRLDIDPYGVERRVWEEK